jgi:hypothetical protein
MVEVTKSIPAVPGLTYYGKGRASSCFVSFLAMFYLVFNIRLRQSSSIFVHPRKRGATVTENSASFTHFLVTVTHFFARTGKAE